MAGGLPTGKTFSSSKRGMSAARAALGAHPQQGSDGAQRRIPVLLREDLKVAPILLFPERIYKEMHRQEVWFGYCAVRDELLAPFRSAAKPKRDIKLECCLSNAHCSDPGMRCSDSSACSLLTAPFPKGIKSCGVTGKDTALKEKSINYCSLGAAGLAFLPVSSGGFMYSFTLVINKTFCT